MNSGNTVTVQPARNISGAVRLPGDKSISHRYAMLAALAEGSSRFENFSTGADCASTLNCVAALGAGITQQHGALEIAGHGVMLSAPVASLDCGNSGSTMRMLAGILVGQEFACEMRGDESLSRRPMQRIITPLEQMGARIAAQADGRPPLRITGAGKRLRAIEYKMPIASAQVKSCLLFAGLLAEGETRIEEPLRTRDHGELALRAFGAEIERQGKQVRIRGGQALNPISATVPGDISSAAFFLCAAALFPESNLVIENALLNPTRAALLDVLTALGARLNFLNMSEAHGESVGTLQVKAAPLGGTVISGSQAAALIDELPVLAAIAPYTRQGIEIRDAGELRVKESDRIAAIAKNLRAMGARVEEHPDGVSVPGEQSLHGAEIDSAGDHRIAMAFSIAALRAQGASMIHGADSARISYPEFFQVLEKISER
jgi:3-phosphoshikimate 1-carboxyvinyltransferase